MDAPERDAGAEKVASVQRDQLVDGCGATMTCPPETGRILV
jgi:hypothetical protein